MDPYKILGVDKNASEEEIRRAYHRQAKKHHPDAGGDAWAFQQVREAYEQLVAAASAPPDDDHSVKPQHETTESDSEPESLFSDEQKATIILSVCVFGLFAVGYSVWDSFWKETVVVKKGILWPETKEVLRFHFVFFVQRLAWLLPVSLVVGFLMGLWGHVVNTWSERW